MQSISKVAANQTTVPVGMVLFCEGTRILLLRNLTVFINGMKHDPSFITEDANKIDHRETTGHSDQRTEAEEPEIVSCPSLLIQ